MSATSKETTGFEGTGGQGGGARGEAGGTIIIMVKEPGENSVSS